MRVEVMTKNLENNYENFILKFEQTMLYSSIKFRNLLKRFLNAEDKYLVAISDNNEIVGTLPLFVTEKGNCGNVINSLPFYGSNGAIICNENDRDVKDILINKYTDLANDEHVATATIITSPFEKDSDYYESHLNYQFKDSRIGQITIFPETPDSLMDMFHSKTRNHIRKGIKMNVKVNWECGLEHLSFLLETHRDNMQKIGGLYKPERFFKLIPEIFEYGNDYRIYVAFENETPIAAMLCFYFNKTVEYFTPVTVEQYREYQPMSVLIYEAMKDAMNNQYRYWNWGGTWTSQEGVYDFKRRWGTTDLNYYYYTSVKNTAIKNESKEVLLREYPYFFVLPFNQLSQ